MRVWARGFRGGESAKEERTVSLSEEWRETGNYVESEGERQGWD